ncbi:hypothetical protein FOZ60_003414 [Perkinsus olseni]|uniref:Katanin p80 subunit C-terminal domain-containing protein n=1 Tax=Perkinsus olseni TaxID=32597 RepID=A0A7J6PI14_PEROL|nr:hypothetical protein FOZ60_003414 [Perkinsus olseni]
MLADNTNDITVSQESAQSHQTSSSITQVASNAEDDLSKHHKKKLARSKRGPKRRSERLNLPPIKEDETSASAVIHGYNTDWVNETLGLEKDEAYSERTVGDWMHFLGFDIVLVKKTLYVDGHEREDVVSDRERFGKQLDKLEPKLLTIDDDTLEVQPNPAAEYILISQDEKIHHSNDVQRRYWSDKSFSKLPTKSQGRTIMTSDFLSEVYGFIKYSACDPLVPGERTGSVLDVSADGYYNSERCQVDFQECSEAVEGLTAADGQRLHCAFLTDRSPIHCKFAEDALNARTMNVKPGGRQPKMRDGWFWSNGRRITQTMVFPATHPVYPGLPKGLREVCRERFGAEAISGKRHEDLVGMLSACEDFKNQATILEDQAAERGDVVIFGVKFHPELAPIEAAYRSIAKTLRVSNTSGSSKGFKDRVEGAQDTEDLTIQLIRKHFRSAREYLALYREGKSLDEIEKLRVEKRKHRGAAPGLRVSPTRSRKGKKPQFSLQRSASINESDLAGNKSPKSSPSPRSTAGAGMLENIFRTDKSFVVTLAQCQKTFLPELRWLCGRPETRRTAMAAVRTLLRNFGSLIIATRSAGMETTKANGQVDLSREDRLERCNSCFDQFASIHRLLAAEQHLRHRSSSLPPEVIDTMNELDRFITADNSSSNIDVNPNGR